MAGLLDMLMGNGAQPSGPLAAMLGIGDPEATGAAQSSQAMEPVTGPYLNDVASGQMAARNMPQNYYDPNRSFAQNATDPRALDQAVNIALSVGPGSIRAYHGSPHDFDQFDLSKIGTGEGAQAYGHGLYFAGNEGVARSYRDNLTSDIYFNDPIAHAHNLLKTIGLSKPDLINKLQNTYIPDNIDPSKIKFLNNTIDALRTGDAEKFTPPGRMYEVNINAEPHQFLDWDQALHRQPVGVQEALGWTPELRSAYDATTRSVDDALLGALRGDIDPSAVDSLSRRADDINRTVGIRRDATGADIVKGNSIFDRASDAAKSAALLDRGIPGIRYLDQGSRDAGNGTSNYVVFNDKLIDILRKYGIAGLLGGGAVAASNPYGGDAAGGQ